MRVEQVMKQAVGTCRLDDTLEIAARIMWDHDCGCVPVVDAEQHVLGMITDRDVCMAAYTQGRGLGAIRVQDTISKNVFSCRTSDSLAKAEMIMRTHQVHRLPAVDVHDRLVGILSLNDLAQEAGYERAAKRKAGITFAQVGQTLEAVCRPRGSHAIAVVA